MKTVLVISKVRATRDNWCVALRRRGMACKAAPNLLGALDELYDPTLAGIVFDAASDSDLASLSALSISYPLPPVVVVPARRATAPLATRMVAGTIVEPGTSIERVLKRLDCLVQGRPLTSPTNLPVRLNAASDAQWTMRLSAVPAFAHDDESFDGATNPDGFDLAAQA